MISAENVLIDLIALISMGLWKLQTKHHNSRDFNKIELKLGTDFFL